MPAEVVSVVPPGGLAGSVPGLEIVAGPLRGGGHLVQDYLAGADALSPFYGGHPADPAAYARKAAEAEARLDAAARARVRDAIEPLGDAAGRLHRILDGDGFFVTTGQQPALFGGPLYTLYKTLAAVRLADRLEAQLGRPVLALFWIGADDHDWDEANHASILDARGYVRTLSVPGEPDAPPVPLAERRWGPRVRDAVDELLRTLPDGELTAELRRHVHEAYTPDATVADAFAATFRLLLRGQRIAMVSSAHPAVRREAAAVLRRDLEHVDRYRTLLATRAARLEAAGYPVQVPIADDAANVMLLGDGGRDRLVRVPGGWATRRDRRPIPEADLLRLLEETPGRFTPNVLLRPVVENAIFPTIAYVAGPGELRYYAQIGCLFEAHGIMPPVVVPRPGVLLLEAPIRRTLGRLNLDPATFARPFADLAADVVRAQLPPDVPAALDGLRARIRDGYAELRAAAAAVDPGLAGPVDAARNASLLRVAEAERRIVRQARRRNDVLMEQLRRVAASLHPGGAPQERVLSPLPFVARHGATLVNAIAASLDMAPRGGTHWTGPACDG